MDPKKHQRDLGVCLNGVAPVRIIGILRRGTTGYEVVKVDPSTIGIFGNPPEFTPRRLVSHQRLAAAEPPYVP